MGRQGWLDVILPKRRGGVGGLGAWVGLQMVWVAVNEVASERFRGLGDARLWSASFWPALCLAVQRRMPEEVGESVSIPSRIAGNYVSLVCDWR